MFQPSTATMLQGCRQGRGLIQTIDQQTSYDFNKYWQFAKQAKTETDKTVLSDESVKHIIIITFL